MVGGDHALTVKSVKCEVSCWLNVDKRFSVSLRLSFIDQDEIKVRRKSKREKKKQGQLSPAAILTSCFVNRGFTIYGPNDENLCLRDRLVKSQGAVSFSLGWSIRTQYLLHLVRSPI